MITNIAIIILAAIASCSAQQPLPAVLPLVTIEGTDSGACPAADVIERARNDTKCEIQSILHDNVTHALNRRYSNQPQCPCGGPGQWTRIAHLNNE